MTIKCYFMTIKEMRRQNTEPLKAVIDRYLKAIGADKKLKEIRLVQQWEEIIGRNIARATDETRNGPPVTTT